MKKLLSALSLSIALCGTANAETIADVELQANIDVQGQALTYYGAGIRKKLFMKLYVGSLYSQQNGLSAEAIIAGESISAVRLNILSSMITSDRMVDTIEEGFEKASNGNVAQLRDRIDNFVGVFNQPIEVGDQFTLVSLPGTGIEAFKNGQLLTMVEGDDFRQTLLAIWLGEEPADDDLKEDMLGL
ncbi:chalcone isomerase family protein [Ferrimonas lipolytica]|uniref:Chalcone isomerase n=1 Tax=Ferrimonas lipolytica TaxID=2724191 RepID=A0A6H1UDP7_9GAMM|nr:chalcone isomerase family protein [Ferrimonas lipolytica]QIZ77205.1 chalcone isomerase [Ferrimonas lipolytica]